jgi:hypothetical protein
MSDQPAEVGLSSIESDDLACLSVPLEHLKGNATAGLARNTAVAPRFRGPHRRPPT